MAEIKIKTKENKKSSIKTIDKSVVGMQKIRNKIADTKEKVNEQTSQNENTSGTDYAVNKIDPIENLV